MRTLSSLVLVGLVVLFAGTLVAQSSASEPYTVAYASFGPLNSAIYVADADGRHERMLASGSVLDMNPSFSPDGRTVLFTSRRNGSADIYRAHIDGSGLERLTDDPAFDDQAVMSPDGRRLAFVSSRSGQADVWVLDLASNGLRNLTSHPGGDYRPAWSPDGQWIAFTSDRDSKGARANTPTSSTGFSPPQKTELYLIRPDGSGLRRLTDSSASVGGAAWSPDSARIAFYEASPADWRAMGTDFMGGPSIATSQIVTLEVATGVRQVLTSGPGRKYSPKWTGGGIAYTRGDLGEQRGVRQRVNYLSHAISFTDGRTDVAGVYSNVNWSPDGRRIVFHRSLDGMWPPVTPTFSRDATFSTVRAGVYPSYSPDGRQLMTNTAYAGLFKNTILVMNPDGTNRRVVFEHPEQNALAPVWSPAGDRIAFGMGAFFAGGRAGLPAHLAVIAADGSDLKMLTSGEGNYGFPSWSPDGKRLVARSSGAPAKGLVVVDAASGSVTPLTAGPQNDNFPAWSPKGDRILFASDRDGDWELYTIRSDGGDLKRLTNIPGNDAHATWSLDGEWIAFASARGGFKDELPVGEGGGQGAGDIFVMRADGSDVRQLTDDAFEEATPAFAPRGPVTAARSSQLPRTEAFPRGCGTSVSERTTETGCYMTAATPLGALPSASVFWHLYVYPTRAAAEAIRGPHGTVVDSFGKYWVFTIAEERWRPASGQRVASIGPLTVARNAPYTARYMEALFPPGAQPVGSGPGHRHPGPEAWYVLSGAQCLETPNGLVMASAGGTAVVPEGWPMAVSGVGSETRRTVLLILHPSSEPYSMAIDDPRSPGAPHAHWKPRGLCPQ